MNALLRALLNMQWAMERGTLEQMAEVLLRHSDGKRLEPEAIEQVVAARDGDSAQNEYEIVGDVAIVPIVGIISKRAPLIGRSSHFGTTTQDIRNNVLRAARDPAVSAIVLNIDSPGGSISGVQVAADAIYNARKRKPVVAYASDVAGSAAYWMASQAESIVANRTAVTGSIGVYTVLLDWSEYAKKEGLRPVIVRSGPYKGVGVSGDAITEDQEGNVQCVIDDLYAVFVAQVARGRGKTAAEIGEVADGSVFVGQKGVAAGLVDKIGVLEDAVRLAKRLARDRTASQALDGIDVAASIGGDDVDMVVATLRPGWTEAQEIAYQGAAVDRVADDDGANAATGVEIMAKEKEAVVAADAVPVAAAMTEPKAPETKVTPPPQEPPGATVDTDAIREEARAEERKRQQDIRAMATNVGLPATWADDACKRGLSAAEANAEALDALAKKRTPVDVQVGDDLGQSTFAPAVIDCLLTRAGTTIEEPHKRAADFNGRTLLDLARMHMEAFGRDTRGMNREAIARAVYRPQQYMGDAYFAAGGGAYGHSTSDFPLILEAVANKRLTDAYTETPGSWQGWMRKRTAPDFKDIKTVKLGEAANLLKVEEGDEYTEATIGEERETYKLAKYGRLFSHTWETLINDDLNALARIPTLHGAAARRLENAVAYGPLTVAALGQTMSDSKTIFHADHNNIGTGAAITVASLGVARKLLRMQSGITTESGSAVASLSLTARYLIVPAALETEAEKLLESLVDPAETNNVGNIFRRKLRLIVEALLDAVDANAWYVAADTNEIDTLEVAFLEGNETPFLDQQDGFSIDGRRYKVRHVVGAKCIDYRGMVRDAGPS